VQSHHHDSITSVWLTVLCRQEMAAALEKQMAEQRTEQAQRTLRERQCYPDNHTAHVPQDSRPWAATTSQLTSAEEVNSQLHHDQNACCHTRVVTPGRKEVDAGVLAPLILLHLAVQAAARQRAAATVQEQNRHTTAARAAAEQQRRLEERASAVRDHQSEVRRVFPIFLPPVFTRLRQQAIAVSMFCRRTRTGTTVRRAPSGCRQSTEHAAATALPCRCTSQ
jgi:hypothetical protein